MKIKCSYCGSYFDDTLANCPQCGAINEGVIRTAKSQPHTIEELQQWYKDRGLPPYETTRFFIGENYTKPRAFGIYKDEHSGNFVVYKNKDSGQRAIRYEGTDEAYAVNELFQRLKQEIIEQKANGVKKAQQGNSAGHGRRNSIDVNEMLENKSLKPVAKSMGKGFGVLFKIIVALCIIVAGIGVAWVEDYNEPAAGYYKYNNEYRYCSDSKDDIFQDGYTTYNAKSDHWSKMSDFDEAPKALKKKRTAKKYYLGKKWNSSMGCSNFLKSDEYQDLIHYYAVGQGYYKYDDRNYYHLSSDADTDWYTFKDNEWTEVSSSNVPEDLTSYSSSKDFYYTPDWDSETQITDFEDTDYYDSYVKRSESATSEDSDSNDDDSWYNDNDSSYDWNSDSDSWDSGGSDWDSDW